MSSAGQGEVFFGIDFGTTNSAVAMLQPGKELQLARFTFRGEEIPSCRSVLYFEQSKTANGQRRVHGYSGPGAIERYLEAEEKGRLIQSLKSHLASRTLTGTEVFGRRHRLEELISRIVSDLRKRAEEQFMLPVRKATVGRPVRFVGAESEEEDEFATSRVREAFMSAGFEAVDFELEPVGAAFAYEATLDHDELILIGDFGGGTSDFSLLRVGPEVGRRGRRPEDLLGNSGVGLAGDAFDARIVRKLVSPALGSNSEARSLDKILPAVPAWIYAHLEHWHYLSFLRTNNVREILNSARIRALEPEKIEALIAVIQGDLGYQLHQAVQKVKYELSQRESADSHFVMAHPVHRQSSCAFRLHGPSSRTGSLKTWPRLSTAWMPCSGAPGLRPPKWIGSSSPAAPPLCPPCGGSSSTGSVRIGSGAVTSSHR